MVSAAQLRDDAGEALQIGRRERNKREKQRRILSAARELFRTHGFAETTTAQIAEAADVGTGTLFLYVRSKEDLLVQVFKGEMIEMARNLFAALPEGASPLAKMMAIFEGMYLYHGQDIEVSKVLLREVNIPSSSERTADIDELLDVVLEGLTKISRNASGNARGNPDVTARSAFAIYYYSLISWIGGAQERDESLALLRQQLKLLLGEE